MWKITEILHIYMAGRLDEFFILYYSYKSLHVLHTAIAADSHTSLYCQGNLARVVSVF